MGIEHWRVIELHPIDLSPETVALRLRDLAQLDELARSLRGVFDPRAGFVTAAEEGLADAEAGRVHSHTSVARKLKSRFGGKGD